jgi:hypothetical protein
MDPFPSTKRCSKLAHFSVAVLLVSATPASAAARAVALLPIRGDAAVEDSLKRELAELYDVVEGEVAQRLRQPGQSAESVRDVASSLRIDTVVFALTAVDAISETEEL